LNDWSQQGGYMIGQREKIWAILRAEDAWLGTIDIMRLAHALNDQRINQINIEPIRRCLQELLTMGMAKKDARYIDRPLWLGVPPRA